MRRLSFTEMSATETKIFLFTRTATSIAALIAALVAIAYVITASTQANQISPLTIENGVIIIDPSTTTCIGDRVTCTSNRLAPGYIHAFVPIVINSHIIKPENDTLAFYYFNNSLEESFIYDNIDAISKPIAFFRDGAAAIGSSPYYMQPNSITIVGTPHPNPDIPIDNSWLPSSDIFFYNPVTNLTSSLTDVCHVQNTSMCGTLFRTSPEAAGVYTSLERVIIGRVNYGLIMASTDSHVITNNITIATVTNNGQAVPCTPTPPYTDYLTSALYLEFYPATGSSCVHLVGTPLKEVIQLNTCLPMSAQPALYALSTQAYTGTITASARVLYDLFLTVSVSFFADASCTTITGTPVAYTLGCPSSPPQSYQWYYSTQ